MTSNIKAVYHYCSYNVLCEIIKNQKLRLSDVTKSNDSMELKYWLNTYEKLRKSFKMLAEQGENYKYLEENLNTINSIIKSIYAFACCFSSDRDLLSQWRAYGDNGKGVALGFSGDKLEQLTGKGFMFKKVEYEGNQKEFDMYDVANILEDGVFERFLINSVFTKSKGFREEKEYRLTYLIAKGEQITDNAIDYSSLNCDLITNKYIDLSIDDSYIDEIIIGPCCEHGKLIKNHAAFSDKVKDSRISLQ